MRRRVALMLAVLMLLGAALAEDISSVIPSDAMWGKSRTRIKGLLDEGVEALTIGENNALKVAGVNVMNYTMDAYYVFSENMRTYYGLSKVTYLLQESAGRSAETLDAVFGDLKRAMEEVIGAPDAVKSAVTLWKKPKYKVEIGKGKFKNYNGSDRQNVAIVVSGVNIPKPTLQPTPTPRPTPTPTPKGSLKEKDKKVTITATCLENNHVGEKWTKAFYINGREVSNGDTIHLKAGESVKARALITEYDENPDKGEAEYTHHLTEKGLRGKFNITLKINVKENEGKYKDNVARWEVRFDFK